MAQSVVLKTLLQRDVKLSEKAQLVKLHQLIIPSSLSVLVSFFLVSLHPFSISSFCLKMHRSVALGFVWIRNERFPCISLRYCYFLLLESWSVICHEILNIFFAASEFNTFSDDYSYMTSGSLWFVVSRYERNNYLYNGLDSWIHHRRQ